MGSSGFWSQAHCPSNQGNPTLTRTLTPFIPFTDPIHSIHSFPFHGESLIAAPEGELVADRPDIVSRYAISFWSIDPAGLTHAERHAATCLSIPCNPQLTDDEVARVIEAVNAFR